MSPRLRPLLIASLVLNLFLLSTAGALAYGWHSHFGLGTRGGWRMRAAGALAEEHGRAFRHAMRETALAARPLARDGRAARLDAARLFVQPGYDAAAIKAALARARAADIVLRGRIEDEVVDFAATLPIDERRALAEALRRGPFRQPARPRGEATPPSGDGSPPPAR